MKTKELRALVALVALSVCGTALAGSKADIVVLTQNQYLGADLTPVIAAATAAEANAALIGALMTVSNNNYPERVQALAESILDKKPHLVALQEMFAFNCIDPYETGNCELFPNAFNDHLAATMAALGDKYEVAAVVQNLTLPPAGFPYPGVPVQLDLAGLPIFIEVIDRDVILAQADLDTTIVDFDCDHESLDGCNFSVVAEASLAGFPINIERGFVGVDVTVDGTEYRFINTHLEVQQLGANPASIYFQTVQASELLSTIFDTFDASKRYIVAGDFNSSPVDVSAIGQPTPYEQLTMFFTDIWPLRPGNPPGFTCCELADLSNAPSQHDERIDIVFTLPAPTKVKANVLDAEVEDKTLSGLWPSDHASVSAELTY
jgi:hypothetical protein